MSLSNNIPLILNDNITHQKPSIITSSMEFYDVTNSTEEFINSQPNSNPTSVQTSSTSSEDESETTKAINNVFASGGGGSIGVTYSLRPPSLNLTGLKRHKTESDIPDLPPDSPVLPPLRISIPDPEKLQQRLIHRKSDKDGVALQQAHETALSEMSPSCPIPDRHVMKGPHFPRMKKSLSWSTRADMTDEVIAHIKEFNKFSPVARLDGRQDSENEI